ncbi:hypothetical protein MNV49_005937 [Pseudohyphozyma bogoriensis]|nr:hypothetical protein MNV49_005937 [Pseudohyphozyma bogoriensis]
MSAKTNNPFAQRPQSVAEQTASRFPDLQGEVSSMEQQRMYEQQQAAYQYQQPTGFQQQQSFQGGYGQQQLHAQPTGFSPASSFGQQLQSQPTGYGGRYGQQNSQQGGMMGQQQGGYGGGMGGYGGQQPQQQQQTTTTFQDLDPYANLGNLGSSSGGGGGGGQGGAAGQQSMSSNLSQAGGGGAVHPRTYVQQYRNELMTWDAFHWKQLLNRLDELRIAWESRKTAIIDAGRQGGDPSQIEALRKQADMNVDGIHAAKFQLSEVQAGWQHSTDPASKARVREALNAGLTSLPEYPPALSPDQLGGSFGQRMNDDFRKQSIMSGFSTPSPQPGMGVMPQQTGYGGGMGYQQTGYGGQQQQVPQFQQSQQTGYPGQQGQFGQQGGFLGAQPTGYYPGQGQQGYGGGYY